MHTTTLEGGARWKRPPKKLGLSLESSSEGWADPALGLGPRVAGNGKGTHFPQHTSILLASGSLLDCKCPQVLSSLESRPSPSRPSLSSLSFLPCLLPLLSSPALLVAWAPTGFQAHRTLSELRLQRSRAPGPPPLRPAGQAPVGAALPGATTRGRQLPGSRPWVWSQAPARCALEETHEGEVTAGGGPADSAVARTPYQASLLEDLEPSSGEGKAGQSLSERPNPLPTFHPSGVTQRPAHPDMVPVSLAIPFLVSGDSKMNLEL